ncbi:hypothetical protein HPC49_20010 [Pyxidicoccus fallax]|uniref:Immunity MXAN-0049 protein domain-containing protein n=1 Tax=Pyxidicoccus fallax TaxID=394095 RepID=A0A848L7E3_9BACT|nr:DUF1629 domain-containing protein [Pyxidicoccus fallax]NMO14689.1 hypothetical protein [Pyxidicoccus fallax]NPC80497.1 hypothetical protein [Pyxidicoccus fallax]
MRHFVLNTMGNFDDDDLCLLRNFVDGIGMKGWRVHKGEPLAPVYPQDAKVFMSDDSPGIKLSSLIGNTVNMLLVSRELKETIEKHCGNSAEYLPLSIYDHRKRLYGRDYTLINPLRIHDCLDFKASDIDWDEENPDEILYVARRILAREKLKDAPPLFRIARDTSTYVVGEALASEMQQRGFTNVVLIELPIR